MSVADHNDLDLEAGENFSISCWAKSTNNSNFYRIACKRGGTAANFPGYEMITKTSSGEFGINLRSVTGANAGPPFGIQSITDGKWHHLALVANSATNQSLVYVDGVLEKSNTTSVIGTESFENEFDLLIGASSGKDIFWGGNIDDFRIWSKALTDVEVLADMKTTVLGTEENLIAAWDFETANGQTVPSLTGEHPGTLEDNAVCIDPNSANMTLAEVEQYHPELPTGIGELNERLVSINFKTLGENNPLTISDIKFSIDPQADTVAMQNLKLYFNGTSPRLDLATAELLGEAQIKDLQVEFNFSKPLTEGNNVFWLCADITTNANEGALIGAQLSAYKQDGAEIMPTIEPAVPLRSVLLVHKLLFSGGDFGSAAYRIPALASIGKRVILAADARINNNGDLPNNIDIVSRFSDDGGITWSEPVVVADLGEFGASDPALVYDKKSGDLLCLFASHKGLFGSTPTDKIRFQVARSADMGETWSEPKEFSDQIYLPGWYAAWVASGSAHQMPDGKIVAAIGARKNSGNTISNFMIYSDDGGYSWQTSPGQASAVGDEAKIVTLDDSRLYMAIRSKGERKITYSSDKGTSWTTPVAEPELVEPGVNGDLIRYTTVKDGYNKSRLLFSIASHPTQRRNLTVFVSYDESETWGTKRVIYPGSSGYSALTSFEDGTIGLFYENGEYENYQLNFARFSLDWLTNGTDTWLPPLGIKGTELNETMFSISPNPACSSVKIRIDSPKNELMSIEAFDMVGKSVQMILPPSNRSGQQEVVWQTNDLNRGVYFLRFRCGEHAVVKKVIVL